MTDKPKDPVPYIYCYLQDLQQGISNQKPLNDNELNEVRNLRKKVEYLKDKLQEYEDHDQHSEQSEDEEEEDIQPKKKNIKAQRQGVSAEVYGNWNKKGDFEAKVVPKSEDTK